MECPFCNHDNIEGVDECERCHVSLMDIADLKEQSAIELDLLHRSLGDLVAPDYEAVSPETPVKEAVRRLNGKDCHCAVVLEAGHVVGIFTERDVLCKLAQQFDRRADAPVSEFMSPNPETLDAGDPVAFALNRMMVGGYRHIPIVRNGELMGVVSVRDIFGYLLDRFGDLVSPGNSA